MCYHACSLLCYAWNVKKASTSGTSAQTEKLDVSWLFLMYKLLASHVLIDNQHWQQQQYTYNGSFLPHVITPYLKHAGRTPLPTASHKKLKHHHVWFLLLLACMVIYCVKIRLIVIMCTMHMLAFCYIDHQKRNDFRAGFQCPFYWVMSIYFLVLWKAFSLTSCNCWCHVYVPCP